MSPEKSEIGERICTNCNMRCTPTQIYCPRCGYILPEVLSVEPRNKMATGSLLPAELGQPVLIQAGTGFFHRQARLYLHHDSGKAILVDVRTGIKVVGRRSHEAAESNLIDLTELGAKEFGVSRRHVQLSLSDESVYAIDLGSTNGTFLNRERLVPEKPYVVRNRAVLQVGVLILRVQFA